jgi:hypothetical protein
LSAPRDEGGRFVARRDALRKGVVNPIRAQRPVCVYLTLDLDDE